MLEVLLLPNIFEKLVEYLDIWSLSQLENCCHLLRELMVYNQVYKKRLKMLLGLEVWKQETGQGLAWNQENCPEEEGTPDVNSRYYKRKIFSHVNR